MTLSAASMQEIAMEIRAKITSLRAERDALQDLGSKLRARNHDLEESICGIALVRDQLANTLQEIRQDCDDGDVLKIDQPVFTQAHCRALVVQLQSERLQFQAQRDTLISERDALREEVARLREQLLGLRNPTYPRP